MNLKKEFAGKLIFDLKNILNKKNIYQVPALKKVVVNVGVGSYLLKGKRSVEEVVDNITRIVGQKPLVINSKLAVSNFRLKKGVPNGVKVTLRGNKMYDFVEKLSTICLPRVRDFRGISKKAFDDMGNYSLGISDITVFPEVFLDDISKTHGVQITFSVKNSSGKEESLKLLQLLGLPFEK